MEDIRVKIDSKPVGKGRPIVTRNGTYTPKKTKAFERLVQAHYLEQCHNKKFEKGIALKVTIVTNELIPKSYNKKSREQIRGNLVAPAKLPDVDNIAKAILDALNGLAFDDDKQVIELHVIKKYSDKDEIYVIIERAKIENNFKGE